MMKKRLVTLITPFFWLLLICSSQIKVDAQQDTINPKLVLNKYNIDICANDPKEFILSIDIGTISKTDSLFVAEITILHRKGKVEINGYLTLGTLFGQFDPAYIKYRHCPASENSVYDTTILQGMNVFNAVSGDMRLVNFTGSVLIDTIDCMDFTIESIYLGTDFKRPYKMHYPDLVELCLISQNLPNRKIGFKGLENNYTIDTLNDTLEIDFFVEATNKKNLKNFNVEIKIDNEFIDDIEISNIYTDYIIEKKTDTNCIIKIDNIDTANINSAKILTAEIIRKRIDSVTAIIHCEINEINKTSCSMNGDVKQIEIKLPEIVSIAGDINENILVLDKNDKIVLKSKDDIIFCKLINLYGEEIDYGWERIGERELLFDKTKLVSGVYFVRIMTNNKTKCLQNIKLIFN